MKDDKRKIVLVGTGMVGMSYAYALLNQAVCDELVLIDIDKNRAFGEAMDMNHGIAFAPGVMRICSGEYSDCSDADLIVLAAGAAQKFGEPRTALLQRNADIFKSIIEPIIKSGFSGIFLVATNPVDIMAKIVLKLSGFPPGRVIGSGTTLDTARLRYLLGEYFKADPRNIHAYVIGEHGDSEFVPWSQAMLATKPILDVCTEIGAYSFKEIQKISDRVRDSAQVIIKAKRATYYGIGMSLVRITKAILGNENSVLTVSSYADGIYGIKDVYLGMPSFVNSSGIREPLTLGLHPDELAQLKHSAEILNDFYSCISI